MVQPFADPFSLADLSFLTTQEGISLGVELSVSGFTCMRFGWAAKSLVPAAEQQFMAVGIRYYYVFQVRAKKLCVFPTK